MEDYKQIIKERLDNLPEKLKTFINSEGWRGNVDRLGRQFNFTEEQLASLENEVFLTLLCFSETKDLAENLKRELGIDDTLARKISDYMNGAVFSQVMTDIKNVWSDISSVDTETSEIKDSIGDSFEQAIINQAKAMQPAKPADSSQQSVDSSQARPDPYREVPE